MFKPIKHVFATFLRKLCKTDGCSQKGYGWKSEETHEPVVASSVLIAPSAVHMLRPAFRETHPPMYGNFCVAATAAARHFRWPSTAPWN